ncbi:MAG: cyclic 2,3-diphosphoglycerate synthase [Bacteroidota bacterium]|nr:cyclic 2,3-diphosphoglycerate synthase [Bacteroidota bacterium]
MARRTLIMGAAGRDFHNFNVFFRGNKDYEVIAFTATQIPGIDDKKYPAELAGKEMYPDGIVIRPEDELKNIIKDENIDLVVFAYSDVPYERVMHNSSIVNAAGADFMLMGADNTTVETDKPVITICASRTGCGKSQTTRRVMEILNEKGLKAVAIRHPMPYGDLVAQKVQRYAELDDLKKHKCTIEEMEEYEPHITRGNIIYAGVDYEAIVREAEKEADVIVWDGGNNDIPFYKSTTKTTRIVVVDPLRVGHELRYYPGETNVRMADIVVINKIDSATLEDIAEIRENIVQLNPEATIIEGASPLTVDKAELLYGKKALVVEDGPTLTHGEMKIGAGVVAALKLNAKLVDPRPYAVGGITETFEKYPNVGTLLPAMGYSDQQIKDLETTINNTDCEVVVIGTPIDLRRIININKPAVVVEYNLQEIGDITLDKLI